MARMHAAKLESSSRLQRGHELLADGREYTTLDIVVGARVLAVNAVIAELRENGAVIDCRQESRPRGRVWIYCMTSPVPEAA